MWWTSQNNCVEKGQGCISQKEKGETRRDKTACEASLFKYVFCFPTEPSLIRPRAHSLMTASAKHKPEEMPCAHANTYANTITRSTELPCAHMLLQASKLTQKHTLKCLKRNKSCRAGWSPPRFLSESFIFAPQQESRHQNSNPRYRTAVPTMEGKKEKAVCFCVLWVCLSGPLRGQTVVLCGPKESFVTGRRLFKLEWMQL